MFILYMGKFWHGKSWDLLSKAICQFLTANVRMSFGYTSHLQNLIIFIYTPISSDYPSKIFSCMVACMYLCLCMNYVHFVDWQLVKTSWLRLDELINFIYIYICKKSSEVLCSHKPYIIYVPTLGQNCYITVHTYVRMCCIVGNPWVQ